ncbi:sugar transferase [Paraeggerthella sp.]|uniref:sugar transferase n=1 Tax=Paraeggerthella sp. TaxID=2897350 RepID=UPI003529CC21
MGFRPHLLGKIQVRACADSLKITPNQREKRVFVLTKGISVVGPRHVLLREVLAYSDYQRQRLLVKPGATCYWQALRNRDSITFDEWVDLDLWKGWALYSLRHPRTAATTSPKSEKTRFRSFAIAHVAASSTVPSADAFCFGLRTCADMMAVM